MTDDAELLRRYAEENAHDAFAELVRRHLDFVYASALRQLRGNTPLAQDVTQLVFIGLARKAARLARHPALVGWLHTATRYAVRGALRSEVRRRAHEADSRVTDTLTPAEPSIDWSSVQPVLDEVLGRLRDRERAAILLRFFEGKRFADVGARLALSEEAARSCVDRALEKMRALLARRGITSTAGGLALALSNQVSVAAPAGLAASITAAGLASATAGAAGLGGWGTFLLMNKIKIAVVSAAVIAGLATVAVDVRANRELRAGLAAARAESAALENLQRESTQLRADLTRASGTNPEVADLARLRDRLAALKMRPEGVTDEAMKPIVNSGRDTPTATFFTFLAGINTGDLSAVADLITFQNDTPAAREAFMASLPEAVRSKYRTPERVFAAGLFNLREGEAYADPAVAAQVLDTRDNNPGTLRVRMWSRQASGAEREVVEKFTITPQGWSIQFRPLTYERDAAEVRARFDPATGEPHRKR